MRPVYRGAAGRRAVHEWCDEQLARWPVAHSSSLVRTTAGPTHVLRAGSGEPAVVLLPGTNANAAATLPLLSALAARRATLAVDLPGQPGLSADARPRRHRLAWYGRWLTEVLDAVAPAGAVVVGHSLGGAVALACPSHRISGRVLVSTAGLTRLQVPPAMLAATVRWLARPAEASSAALLRRMLAPGHEPPAELVDWYALVGRHCRTTLAPPPLPPALLAAGRGVPVVVATGAHDVFLPPHRLRGPARERLGTELRVLAGAGHLATDEAPERIAALVDELVGASAS